jgi:L-lactate dehydrogenase complex protein LldG
MSGSRDAILGRIREALTRPAPLPGGHSGDEHAPAHAPQSASKNNASHFREWLPAAGETWGEWIALFARNSAELKTSLVRCENLDAAQRALKELAALEAWKQVAFQPNPLVERATAELRLPLIVAEAGYDVRAMERCDAGITVCDALIAQTGSILLTTKSAGGRTVSVLPEHHVVLATREQLLPDLPAGYALLKERYGEDLPSFTTLITGPSRTGDIERILVLGAHGPKRLTVLLLDNSAIH